MWPGAGPQRARRRPRGGGPAQAIEIDRFPRAGRSACCGRPSRPCPTLNRTNVRQERDWYERNRTDAHVSHGPPAAPGDSGPPAHTAAPRRHPGHTPRSRAQPAGTTHYASPAPAAGQPHTAKRAPDRRDTPPAPREHHRRASRQTTQRISQATVDDVVLRHQPSNGGSRTRLFRHLRMRAHKARIRRMSCILNATVHPDGRTADHARKPRPPQARMLSTVACRHEPGAGAGTGTSSLVNPLARSDRFGDEPTLNVDHSGVSQQSNGDRSELHRCRQWALDDTFLNDTPNLRPRP